MYVDAYVTKRMVLVGPYSNYGPGFDYVAAPVGTAANVS